MYSDKENINILTSLVASYPIRHAVVCPGSRNAPIAHNLNECEGIICHAVTDERSAGFYALGLAQATGTPALVCVTSGSALLNVMPAVAEAYYQHIPLLVISADRPAAWIDQQDGQTIRQANSLGQFFKATVSLPEPKDDTERWHCNRLVNEALISMTSKGKGPVHINVPITEPLFNFTTESLPQERQIAFINGTANTYALADAMLHNFLMANRPMIVVGQMPQQEASTIPVEILSRHAVVLTEQLSAYTSGSHFEPFIMSERAVNPDYLPDFIIYVGGNTVSKALRQYLRKAKDAETWIVNESGEITDTFMNLSGVIEGNTAKVLEHLAVCIERREERRENTILYRELWHKELEASAQQNETFEPEYSHRLAVKMLEEAIGEMGRVQYNTGTEDDAPAVHYANSSAVRLGCLYARHHIYCNRGVNGIEGSLSTAAGFSVFHKPTFCVIGDLSFFYDQNALWNTELDSSLHILLLNNGCGSIFHKLKGLDKSPACDKYIAASHNTTAEGICHQNGITYLQAHNRNELACQMAAFTKYQGTRPVLLEVFCEEY